MTMRNGDFSHLWQHHIPGDRFCQEELWGSLWHRRPHPSHYTGWRWKYQRSGKWASHPMWWILSSCLISSPQNQSCVVIHHNSCSSLVCNGNISHNLLPRLGSHDPLAVDLSHLLQHSQQFCRLQKVFKMLGFFGNPLNKHQKTCI